MSFRSLMNNTVNIKRKTQTADGQGGYAESWSTIYRRVPCRFNAMTADEMELVFGKQGVYPAFNVYMEYRPGLVEGDRLLKGSREYDLKLVQNWDEADNYLKIAVVELGRVD